MQSRTETRPRFQGQTPSLWWSPISFILGIVVTLSFLSVGFKLPFGSLEVPSQSRTSYENDDSSTKMPQSESSGCSKLKSESHILELIDGNNTRLEPLPEPEPLFEPEPEPEPEPESLPEHEPEHTPSLKFITGQYGKAFTPKFVVGITSFLVERTELMSHSFPDLLKERETLAPKTAQTLNFVVAGFPKTGTSFLMKFLNNEGIEMIQGEQCQLSACTGYSLGNKSGLADEKPLTLVKRLIEVREEMPQKKIAIKCPNTIEDDLVDEVYSTYFPNASMIIGLRHPVRWFESFYNHRLRTEFQPAPLAYDLVGSRCIQGVLWKLCTDRAKFALPLSKLGHTNLTDVEVALLTDMVHASDIHREEKRKTIKRFFEKYKSKKPSIGKIFLYDLGQLADDDDERLEIFGKDLSEFLELDKPLVIPHRDPPTRDEEEKQPNDRKRRLERITNQVKPDPYKSGYLDYAANWHRYPVWKKPENHIKEVVARHEKIQINICDELYDDLRQELLEDGKKTSGWILNYFLKSENVRVSQKAHFESLIAQYAIDPCIESPRRRI